MARTTRPIAGQRILITGAARGIGAEAARRLARGGARLCLVGLEPERLRELTRELGGDAFAVEADVRDEARVRQAVEHAVERFGGIDVVIANAGVAYTASAEHMPPAEVQTTIDVNLGGVINTVRASLPALTASRGQIVLVASLAAALQMPLLAAYSATKAGVHAYGNCLRLELAGRGVTVTVAYFGFIDTDMGRLAGGSRSTAYLMAGAGPLGKILPVSKAVDAMVTGIERRSRRIVAPKAILPAILAPGIFQAISELTARSRVTEALRLSDDELHSGADRASTPGLVPGERAAPGEDHAAV